MVHVRSSMAVHGHEHALEQRTGCWCHCNVLSLELLFVGNFDFRGVCFTKIADCFKLLSSILCSIGGFFHNPNSRTVWFIACSWKSWLLGRRFCSFYLFVCMPTSCHTLNRPQRLSLVWQNTSPSLALQALGNSFAYIVSERVCLLSAPMHGSLS